MSRPSSTRVAGEERDRLQVRAAARVLAGQRLHDAGELRPQEVEQGPGGELGHAPAAGRGRAQGALVERLDEVDAGVVQERREQAGHEVRGRVDQVGVDEHHDVAPT